VALLLAALLLDKEEGSYLVGQELTICIKWYMGGLDIVLEDGSSQIKDVLKTYVVTRDNMVGFVGDLKHIQTFLDNQQDWGLPMKLTVKYLLHQEGVNRYDCMLVAPVVADQFNKISTTKSSATIPTTIHVSLPNEEDSVMTSHHLMITPGGGNQADEVGTAGSSSVHSTGVSLESQQFLHKTAPTTRQAMPMSCPMMSRQKSPSCQMKSTSSSFAHWPPPLVSKRDRGKSNVTYQGHLASSSHIQGFDKICLWS
jgi:hypothetical protein